MPTMNNQNLTLTTVNDKVTIKVTYNVGFSPFELHLVANGLKFQEHISVIGVDPPNSTAGRVLKYFRPETLPIITTPPIPTLQRNRSITVSRASLQEDAGLGDDDEIRCRIEIKPIGMPGLVTGFTDQEILTG